MFRSVVLNTLGDANERTKEIKKKHSQITTFALQVDKQSIFVGKISNMIKRTSQLVS